jgi:hypothetical protein
MQRRGGGCRYKSKRNEARLDRVTGDRQIKVVVDVQPWEPKWFDGGGVGCRNRALGQPQGRTCWGSTKRFPDSVLYRESLKRT